MNIFFILVGVSFAGILAVFWLLRNENKPSLRDLGAPMPAMTSPPPPQAKKSSMLAGLFAKFKKEKEEAKATVPLPGVTDFVEKSFVVYQDKPAADPAAPQVVLSAAEEKKIEQEIDLAAQIEEWKGKYERLDKLFNEKSAALAKSEESLKAELNNRKEFNKIKDILEKDLREARDKTRGVQTELNTARTEAERNKKKAAQLEEKIPKMEKAILGKDDEIAVLNKRLQAAASAPPAAAAPEPGAPPEQPKEEDFLKLQPDILIAADSPAAATAGTEIQKGEPVEPKQSSDPALPEANPQGSQDKPASEGQTNQQDEQKKE